MKNFAVIVAGGSGTRMGNVAPKQFLKLAGKPVLMHTIEVLHGYDEQMELVVVLPAGQMAHWAGLCREYHFDIRHRLAEGGATRFHSVQNGLSVISGEGIVFIHDGVRPLVSPGTISRCHKAAKELGNAIPAIPVGETVRWSDGQSSHVVDREKLVLIQTPQTFKLSLIKEAFTQPYDPGFTDEASVIEKAGQRVNLVEGNRENIKITWPADLDYAQFCLNLPPNKNLLE